MHQRLPLQILTNHHDTLLNIVHVRLYNNILIYEIEWKLPYEYQHKLKEHITTYMYMMMCIIFGYVFWWMDTLKPYMHIKLLLTTIVFSKLWTYINELLLWSVYTWFSSFILMFILYKYSGNKLYYSILFCYYLGVGVGSV